MRRDGPPDHLPGPAEFDTTTSQLGAAYESAWLACRLLAGRAASGPWCGSTGWSTAAASSSSALRATFGLTAGGLTRAWRRSLSDLAA